VERAVDLVDIERSGIKVLSGPLHHFLVLRMLGILDHLQEMVVTRQTADVLRRQAPRPARTIG